MVTLLEFWPLQSKAPRGRNFMDMMKLNSSSLPGVASDSSGLDLLYGTYRATSQWAWRDPSPTFSVQENITQACLILGTATGWWATWRLWVTSPALLQTTRIGSRYLSGAGAIPAIPVESRLLGVSRAGIKVLWMGTAGSVHSLSLTLCYCACFQWVCFRLVSQCLSLRVGKIQ